MTKEEFEEFMTKREFRFAKTMKDIPHAYTHIFKEKDPLVRRKFKESAVFIRENGYEERFYNRVYTYYAFNGYKYWQMDEEPMDTVLINRAEL